MKVDRVIVTKAKPERIIPAVAEQIIPAERETRRTVTDVFCDICKEKKGQYTCHLCGRDICEIGCFKWADINHIGGDYGDDRICIACLALWDKYKEKEDVIEEEHDAQDETLREEWKAESLAIEEGVEQ